MNGAVRMTELSERFSKEPLVTALGAELVKLSALGWAVIKVPPQDYFCVIGDIVQGGIVATVADFAGVYAAMGMLPAGHTPAGNINIDFLRPVMKGETMFAQAKLKTATRGSIWMDVDVYANSFDPKNLRAQARIHFLKPKQTAHPPNPGE